MGKWHFAHRVTKTSLGKQKRNNNNNNNNINNNNNDR